MNFKTLKLKSKLSIGFTLAIVLIMVVVGLIASQVTKSSLTRNLKSSLHVISQIAAKAVKVGLEFDDKNEVASAVNAFTSQELFSYISVTDKNGNNFYLYRKSGFPDIQASGSHSMEKLSNEMFNAVPVESNGTQIGTVTIGISLEERNRALSSARKSIAIISFVMIIIFICITLFIAKMITKPIQKISKIAVELERGNLNQEITNQSGDEIGQLTESFRKMINAQRTKANVANELAQGNLDVDIKVVSEQDVLGAAMVTMKDSLRTMQADLQNTIQSFKAGNIDTRCHPNKMHGAYAELLKGVNDSLDAVIEPLWEGIDILQEYSKGNLRREMRVLPGKQIVLTEGLNGIRNNLRSLIKEGVMLATAADEGRLSVTGDTSKFEGDYCKIIQGMNNTVENILKPVREAVGCLEKMANGDLTVAMTGDYKGDDAMMKDAMNTTLKALNDTLGQVALTVEQVSSGAHQVSYSSHSLSQGATEQASSLEEVSSTMTELGSQTKQNAENAIQANQIATTSRDSADQGTQQMKQMLSAMAEINQASRDISKIIKVIDEIAFQTNLLALNAAVEAARAGVHGKGFAVVAEEVRNLAQRSAKAAKETTELIEGSVKKVENGTNIANKTAKALNEIVDGVTKVTDLVGEIARASKDQDQGIQQVNQSLGDIDQVTQSNTAVAEESASAAELLSKQAMQVENMLNKFKLKKQNVRTSAEAMKISKVNIVDGVIAKDDQQFG